MPSLSEFEFRVDNKQITVWYPDLLDPIISVVPKEWESNFFKRSFAVLEVAEFFLSSLDEKTLKPLLIELFNITDKKNIDLIELSIDSRVFGLIPTLEAAGFRLVDSKVCFFTLIDRLKTERFDPAVGSLAMAQSEDLPAIIDLTKAAFCHNPNFFSRFKHPRYYSTKESENYYSAWITNHFDDPRSLMAVMHDKGVTQGYFFYRQGSLHEELPAYKGMLAAVAPDYRRYKSHLALQTFLFDQIPHDRFFVDNTTQLTNFPILKNHITAQRQLQSVTFIFYRKRLGQD